MMRGGAFGPKVGLSFSFSLLLSGPRGCSGRMGFSSDGSRRTPYLAGGESRRSVPLSLPLWQHLGDGRRKTDWLGKGMVVG